MNRQTVAQAKAKGAAAEGGILQRKCACGNHTGGGECKDCRKKKQNLQRRKGNGSEPIGVPPVVHDVLRSSGQPLDPATRAFMEPRFGYDFSGVRVHTDDRAAKSTNAVNAWAYTAGRNIVFGRGRYEPRTAEGQRLLAHELTHVVQQSQFAGSDRRTEVSKENDASEREAEQAADRVLAGSPVSVRGDSTSLQRYSHEDCSEDDLRAHIWPADSIARQMTSKVLRVLRANANLGREAQVECVKRLGGCASTRSGGVPTSEEISRYNEECRRESGYAGLAVTPTDQECGASPGTAASPLERLLLSYFRTTAPRMSAILSVYQSIQNEFASNDYQYECEEDCPGARLGYVWGVWSDIHLCMNHLRGLSNDCIARTIVHEFSHYYAGTDDYFYCKSGCGYSSCPEGLSAANALSNADSYACLAYELFPMPL